MESIGTTLSPFELSKALSEHRLAIGAELEHPKQGRKVVQVNGSADSPYKLVDAGELPDN